jgi:hypothetical protein
MERLRIYTKTFWMWYTTVHVPAGDLGKKYHALLIPSKKFLFKDIWRG